LGLPLHPTILKQNWNQFLFAVKATFLKQQISKFYPQILSRPTDDSDHIYVSQCPVTNVVFADKILIAIFSGGFYNKGKLTPVLFWNICGFIRLR